MLDFQQKRIYMDIFFEILSHCPLFNGITTSDLTGMLKCLNAKSVEFSKGDSIFLEGDPAQFVGVVLDGAIQILQEDYYGNRSVLTILEPGELFAEVFSCAGLNAIPVSAIAIKKSTVLLLNCQQMFTVCGNACRFHSQLLQNLLKVMAMKNLAMTQKIRYMSQKTTKDKLTAFLLDQAKQNDSSEFVIPYDRQALADYLGVERSAMSVELSKLKKNGQIDTKGSWFRLLELNS